MAWIKDAQLRYTYLSENCQKALGRSSEEFLGRDDFEPWPAEAAAERRARDLEVQSSRQALQAVQSSTDPDGNLSHWLVVKFPFRDADGRVGVAGVGLDITDRMQVQETLRHFAERNRQLQYRLLRAHDRTEQRRLAALLHDLIGQNLTILGLGVEFVRGHLPEAIAPQAAERLTQMGPLVESTISMVREVMVDMHPPVLDDYGLVPALRWYAQAFEARTGLRIRLGRGEPAKRPAREVELALFRVVQEALTNAAKHGGAQSAGIEVSCDSACIRVTVTDDGAGIAERPQSGEIWRGGWGLPAMRERMEAVGGSLSIESSAQGTCVTARVPLRSEAQPS
ncbi:MAG: PAS domain-containing protein [Betaproteobacteria bacterium]|nr:PAS domain-containing protein [Betaproteobacteria bacterium]